MNIALAFQTIRHLKAKQICYQVRYRINRPHFKDELSPIRKVEVKAYPSIVKYETWNGKEFCFINISSHFKGWDYTENGMLWAYNQNYMDWLGQKNITKDEGEKWIDRFINDLKENKIGLDPYPIALRSINWIKFFCKYPKSSTKKRLDSLFSQITLLDKKLEYHLLGNHLLEDFFALFIGAVFFKDKRLFRKACFGLEKELNEQILNDGAHFEQSPMYHCIMLDRLLDCYNISINNELFEEQKDINNFLKEKASKMLGHLNAIVYKDGSIPLLNDSALEIAPTTSQLFEYADRLGIIYETIDLKECGYRKIGNERFEAIIDIGNMTASYQPGHSHADTFNFELRIDGKPIIVDTGISTYNKNTRRQYERSTAAHNTVTVDGLDSSRVWGGFRVGKRAKVNIIKDEKEYMSAELLGLNNNYHCRTINVEDNRIVIEDHTKGKDAKGFIHFSPSANVTLIDNHIETEKCVILIENADKFEIKDDIVSVRYNELKATKKAVIYFKNKTRIIIGIK